MWCCNTNVVLQQESGTCTCSKRVEKHVFCSELRIEFVYEINLEQCCLHTLNSYSLQQTLL